MFDIIKYWMDLGVDGFRFDAVTKLIEDDRWLDEPRYRIVTEIMNSFEHGCR